MSYRTDRKEQATQEFARIGCPAEFITGSTSDNPILGFNKTYRRAFEIGGNPLVIFEDDVVFDIDNWQYIAQRIAAMPEGWMTLHLGCNIIGVDTTAWQMPTHYAPGLARLHNAWQTHANVYSKACVEFVLREFPYWEDKYLAEGCYAFDEWLRTTVMPLGHSYVLNPMIAYQRPSHSDVWNVQADYTGCHKQGNEYLRRIV